ncbi:uncharacterized protein TRIREDRAFT_66023 [Trichoderma reesei QM6a]|uniref:Predicted protein n=2 Tax=Hypocrea jecorina TaxID=51453 RepID=G0RQ99_HYPJQ|nr:uncharacterized protein TRIREDRAFT_66023 [Trichoderma reesei QM6a]EGR46611.1 predicted protein [Trichoderma reesei QM6a]ETS00273.1 hypothetical protein M419DRAFT_131868 [Trichoderma reesei RUT C-30]
MTGQPLDLGRRESITDGGEEGNFSDDQMIPDQDDAQAVLQPAMSAAASHLTSLWTPAIEKAAAMQRPGANGFFDEPELIVSGDTTPKAATSPKSGSPPRTQRKPIIQLDSAPSPKSEARRYGPPSPWKSQQHGKDSRPLSDARGILHAAFEPTRQRSRSAGQEALKKLQQAFPSLSTPSNFLPSLSRPRSFLSSFTDGKHQRSRSVASRRRGHASVSQSPSNSPPPHTSADAGAGSEALRPPLLRRTTSDDSMLYHSLSRASSLGDDNRFTDVREQVNVRFMAIKDSLPDVPNFKMPSMPTLAKLQAVSRRSTISLNNIFSNEPATHSKPQLEQDKERDKDKDKDKDDSERLDRVLAELTGDIVVMGGYRGSILRSAEPPHQQLWAPVKLGLNMRKANLEVGLDDEDEETMEERIIPSGMLQHIGPIDISRKFFKKLRSCENARTGRLRVWDYGYDWRLSPARLSKRLQDFLATLPSNQPGVPAESRGAIVVAHSLGGLITRHAVNQQPHLFAGVLFCGTPMRCINILGPLRNGDAVLFNDKLLTAQVNFSIRTSFTLLPDDGFCFVDRETGEPYPVDFFDPDSWVKWRLSPCVAPPLPPYNRSAGHSPLANLFPKNSFNNNSSSTSTNSYSSENKNNNNNNNNSPPSPPPPTTIDPERFRRNYDYLARVLAATKQFRSELAHNPTHQLCNAYPPLAVIYSKSIPTVYAARVSGREAIPCADAYDDLVFRPGDGVVLAKESMLPEGYSLAKGGRVSTERGHVSMMGDLPALAKGLGALVRGRRKGIGYGALSAAGLE